MKTSELIKLLKKNHCHLAEHGKEHDKWYSDPTTWRKRNTNWHSKQNIKGCGD